MHNNSCYEIIKDRINVKEIKFISNPYIDISSNFLNTYLTTIYLRHNIFDEYNFKSYYNDFEKIKIKGYDEIIKSMQKTDYEIIKYSSEIKLDNKIYNEIIKYNLNILDKSVNIKDPFIFLKKSLDDIEIEYIVFKINETIFIHIAKKYNNDLFSYLKYVKYAFIPFNYKVYITFFNTFCFLDNTYLSKINKTILF